MAKVAITRKKNKIGTINILLFRYRNYVANLINEIINFIFLIFHIKVNVAYIVKAPKVIDAANI
jgi:hypothetical protein